MTIHQIHADTLIAPIVAASSNSTTYWYDVGAYGSQTTRRAGTRAPLSLSLA